MLFRNKLKNYISFKDQTFLVTKGQIILTFNTYSILHNLNRICISFVILYLSLEWNFINLHISFKLFWHLNKMKLYEDMTNEL